MRRRHGWLRWVGRTALLGFVVVPAIAALTFGALVVGSEAFLGSDRPGLGDAVRTALISQGFLPTTVPTTLPPTASATPTLTPWSPQSEPPAGDFVQDPARPLHFTLTPSPTTTASSTASPTATTSATPTVTATLTATPTATPTASWTPATPPTSTATRRPTATPSRTPVPTHTSEPSSTPPPTSTDPPADTATPGPSPTSNGSTPTAVPPTVTSPPSDTPAPTATPSGSCSTSINVSYENEIVSLVNEVREANGRPDYQVDSRLRAAARAHAADMACNHFTGHTGSDGSSVGDRVLAQGYGWSWIGENYMVTRNGPQTAFDWWMNSTPHTNNILSPNYTEFGVGVIYGPDSDYGGYFVIVFARPG